MVTPAGAPQGARRVRPLEEPKPITVFVDETGSPTAVELGGRRLEGAVRSRWRVDDGWWREQPVARLYYELLLEDGKLLTVFSDLVTGEWYQQRYA